MVRSGNIAATPRTAGWRPSILVVDDYPSMLEWLTRRLQIGQMNVLTASTGEDAVAIALREKPDLALIDYRLPGIDGVETADAIRATGVVLPWILFSGIQDYEAMFKATQHGALGVVWSPFDPHTVAREALDTLAKGAESDWSRLLRIERIPRPETTARCTAWWVLKACPSPR
jgi:DNA-binding NtrC family response regulator